MVRHTRYIRVNPRRPAPPVIALAADILRRGGLVAFPTETVYGLGANALSERAVGSIFTAKGRPADNPLIVHVSNPLEVSGIVTGISMEAEALMRHFWPGPLTLVLPSNGRVAPVVTAGLDTVAVRMPRHPVALALLRLTKLPVAAPSANLSGKPSPTLGRHVLQDLRNRVDLILEAGATEVGVESTVVDLTAKPPLLLRPGGVTLEDLKLLIGEVRIDPAVSAVPSSAVVPRSPGMKYRHYAPRAPLYVVRGGCRAVRERIADLTLKWRDCGRRVAILSSDENGDYYLNVARPELLQRLGPHADPAQAASKLYASLKICDQQGVDFILAEAWPEEGLGLALMNRLCKAAGFRVISAVP